MMENKNEGEYLLFDSLENTEGIIKKSFTIQ